MGEIIPIKIITIPVGKAGKSLERLVRKLEPGTTIVLTSRGKPKALLTSYVDKTPPPRVTTATPVNADFYSDPDVSPLDDDWVIL